MCSLPYFVLDIQAGRVPIAFDIPNASVPYLSITAVESSAEYVFPFVFSLLFFYTSYESDMLISRDVTQSSSNFDVVDSGTCNR